MGNSRTGDRQKNGPLPGVSVCIKGTTKGMATDSKGEYKLVLAPQKKFGIDVLIRGNENGKRCR